MIPVYGIVELKNGLVIKWLRFADSKAEAVRIVTAQHAPAVADCYSL
jgi:hypothetical protein